MSFLDGEDILATDYIIQVVAGETLATRDAVYISDADGKAYKTDQDDLTKIGFVGFVVLGVSAAATVNILPWGVMGGFSSLTPNALYYLSATAGAITVTKPANFKIVAKAISATAIHIWQAPTERIRVYTSSDTWTKPGGLLFIDIECQAPGGTGGGGSGSNWGAAGGGSGGYARKRAYPADLAATETVTIGATTSFTLVGTDVSCTSGGNASTTTPGTGGSASGGDVNIAGNSGAYGKSGAGEEICGSGASSPLGIGGGGRGSSGAGVSASGYGAGGGGALNTGSSNSFSGGSSSPGIIIVKEYY